MNKKTTFFQIAFILNNLPSKTFILNNLPNETYGLNSKELLFVLSFPLKGMNVDLYKGICKIRVPKSVQKQKKEQNYEYNVNSFFTCMIRPAFYLQSFILED